MSTTLTHTDYDLAEAVSHQLAWDPSFDEGAIAVAARDGVVTLAGHVDSYSARLAAERAAGRVYGVRAIVNALDVTLAQEPVDAALSRDAREALAVHVEVPAGIGVTVRDGVVTLTGHVEWMFQKQAAEDAVSHLRGIRGVTNDIAVTPRVLPMDVRTRLRDALYRHADLAARQIHVRVDGSRVTLSGNVRSPRERYEAVEAAWSAPGVASVDNRLNVVP